MDSKQPPLYKNNIKFTSLLTAPLSSSAEDEYLKPSLKQQFSPDPPQPNQSMVNSVYEKTLEFPSGQEHLKYFDHNPHPDKIPDESLLFAEPFLKKDLNTPLLEKRLQFQLVKDKLWPSLTDKERKILLLPEKLNQFISLVDNPYAKAALEHLSGAFLTYLSTPIDKSVRPDIQWIDYKFATDYEHAQEALGDLEKNLLNSTAKNKLEEKLREAGAFGKDKIDFYFWNTSPYNWSEISYQSRSVQHIRKKIPDFFEKLPLSRGVFGLIPQYAALGDFTINAIPEGYIQPQGNGKYKICVKKVYFFVNDVFNFEGKEYLCGWALNNDEDCDPWGYAPITNLFNSDLMNYKRHGYGPDFPVLSRLHQSENFKPDCWTVRYGK